MNSNEEVTFSSKYCDLFHKIKRDRPVAAALSLGPLARNCKGVEPDNWLQGLQGEKGGVYYIRVPEIELSPLSQG